MARRTGRTKACLETPNARTGRSHRFPHRYVACHVDVERSENVSGGIADMNADGKSDDFIVLSTRANKAAAAAAESVEERESPKGSLVHLLRTFRTQCRAWRHLRGLTITTGSEPMVRDRLTQRRSRMSVVLHVRICAGGCRQRQSLPRSPLRRTGHR